MPHWPLPAQQMRLREASTTESIQQVRSGELTCCREQTYEASSNQTFLPPNRCETGAQSAVSSFPLVALSLKEKPICPTLEPNKYWQSATRAFYRLFGYLASTIKAPTRSLSGEIGRGLDTSCRVPKACSALDLFAKCRPIKNNNGPELVQLGAIASTTYVGQLLLRAQTYSPSAPTDRCPRSAVRQPS